MATQLVSQDQSTRAGRAYRVLLVEDNPAEAELVCERLASSTPGGFEVTHALDMKRAVRACSTSRFDCIVLDLQLPDTKGVETIRAMRAENPDAAIVAYSGLDDEASRSASLREGAQDFISKNGSEAGSLDRSILFALERWRALKLHRQLEAVFAAAPDAMLVCGADGLVRFANPVANDLFDRREGLVGEKLDLLLTTPTGDVEIERRGEMRLCEIRIGSCIWDDEPCLLASIRDVTEQRALGDRLRKLNKMELIGRFAGGLAHDFGNVLGCIDLMAEGGQAEASQDPPVASRFKKIRTTAEAGRAIVRQLLSLEQSQMSSPALLDLRAILGGMEDMLRQVLPDEIQLHISCAEDVSPVLIDREHIEQVLLNLVFNARDAMAGGGVLRIACADCSPPSAFVCVSVSDTGCGIPAADLPRVFDLFFTTKASGRGSGIGLAICQSAIERVGGVIEVQSTLGRGTCFRVLLPKQTPATPLNA